jgi:hypothetical protein
MTGLYLADFTENIAILIPVIALMIPIVAILVSHQQKMAQIIHGANRQQVPNPEVDSLKREVQELKQLIHQQTIALDSATRSSSSIQDRMTEVS